MSTYNGHKNYVTWNVVLWIENDTRVCDFAKDFKDEGYLAFADCMRNPEFTKETPDGVLWTDSDLDIPALDRLLKNL